MKKLYDWQADIAEQGKRILEEYNMLYLALWPRSGKTPITLDIIDKVYESPRILFVTTKSAIKGIYKVIDEFGFNPNINIINYEQLRRVEHEYDVIVLDEAHSKISKFPKPAKAYKELERIIPDHAAVIWLSGTPKIESNAKLYHQLSLSYDHPWSEYKNFYRWHDKFGIKGLFKYTGGPRPSVDYSKTVSLVDQFEYFTIKDTRTSMNAFKLYKIDVSMPKQVKDLYDEINTHSVCKIGDAFVIASNGAARNTKLHQLCGGSIIDDEDKTHLVSSYKASRVANFMDDMGETNYCIFYKFEGERQLLSVFFDEKDLFQIDSNCTGIDLSHYDSMVVYNPTYSGSNWTQVLNRLCNTERKDTPNIYVFLTGMKDKDIFEEVSAKYNSNMKFLNE